MAFEYQDESPTIYPMMMMVNGSIGQQQTAVPEKEGGNHRRCWSGWKERALQKERLIYAALKAIFRPTAVGNIVTKMTIDTAKSPQGASYLIAAQMIYPH
jgi:hypothetical protein